MVSFSDSNFWVKRAALNLFGEMPEGSLPKDSFFDLPPWLREASSNEAPFLPWLPFDISKLPEKRTKHLHVPEKQNFEAVPSVAPSPSPKQCPFLSNHAIERAVDLKKEIRTVESVPETIDLAEKIQYICTETQNSMEVLNLIEPWEINDDLTRVLLSNISVEPSLIFSSIVLPKLLTLHKQPSSLIISSTVEFCKKHPIEAVNSLLFPLIFRTQGLNMPLCDLITKVTRDCMHPLHVSFFILRLLCAEEEGEIKSLCLPQHREQVSNELVWNDSLFLLFYNMINRDKDVILTPDSVEKLVSVIGELASKFVKSLKFGSFVLCFVNKCGDKLISHKEFLERAAAKTDTFVTKAILVRLHSI
jgi:hypothetical protein